MPWLPSRFLLAPLPVPFSVGRFVLLRSCPILAASAIPGSARGGEKACWALPARIAGFGRAQEWLADGQECL